VSKKTETIEKIYVAGVGRLLARATDTRKLTAGNLIPRIRSGVEKYVLRDDPQATPASIEGFIDKLQADDLCLIVACELGDQNAWSDLVERFSATVRSAARSASSNEESAEDLAQSIWAELHGLRVNEEGRPAGKLAYYSGRGSLAGWLRAVVAQLAVDQHRKQSRLVQTEEDADFDRIIQQSREEDSWSGHGGVVDPEQEVSTKIAGAQLREAVATAVNQLSAEDRLLVKLYYFDGLKLHEAGTLLGFHEATASRRLTRIYADLRQRVEARLTEEGWTRQETKRAFAEIALHLEADIEPLLRESVLLKKENEIAG
jgi:RNA polymerase sigma-70 factor